jgi:hypothetical protein
MGEGDQVREDQAGVRQEFYFPSLAAMRSSPSRPPHEQSEERPTSPRAHPCPHCVEEVRRELLASHSPESARKEAEMQGHYSELR